MLTKAYDLLEKQYQKCLNIVQSDAFFTAYADEKKRHSLQVAGAGNYLIKHINWLQNKPADFIELVKTAVLLQYAPFMPENEADFAMAEMRKLWHFCFEWIGANL